MSKLQASLKFIQNETKNAKAMTTFDPYATITDVELLSVGPPPIPILPEINHPRLTYLLVPFIS